MNEWRQVMTHKEFVEATVCKLNQPEFDDLKQLLLGEYISFSIIDHEAVTKDILAEKVCDYFVTLEAKTGKAFDKHIESYLNDLDSIVKPHIVETPQTKKVIRHQSLFQDQEDITKKLLLLIR